MPWVELLRGECSGWKVGRRLREDGREGGMEGGQEINCVAIIIRCHV